jgi:hypothetical protein
LAGLVFLAPVAQAQTPLPESEPSAVPGYVATTEEVSAFSSILSVGTDGWLEVNETISYYFPDERHGLVRAVPFVYEIDGKKWQTPLRVESVMRPGGSPVPYSERANGALWEIKIGEAAQTVTGLQTYVIRYRVAGVIKRFADHDEVYWNATGNDWDVPVRRVAATVSLPEGTAVAGPVPVCYVGAAGSTNQEGCVKNVGARGVSFAAGGPMTVVVGFTPGVIAITPMVAAPFPWGEGAAALLPLLALAVMYSLWRRYGRDPAGRGTIVVQYDPPDQLPPGMMGVIVDESSHQHDLAATIVDLAVRGYLKIVETERPGLIFGKNPDYDLVKVKEYVGDAALRPYEREVLDVVLGGTGITSLYGLKQTHLLNLKMKDINAKLMADCVAGGYFPESPLKARAKYLTVAGGLFFVFIMMFRIGLGSPAWIVSIGVTSAIIALFGWQMPRRTPKGVAAREHALGFKDYLATAEKYRLQWQETENVFEKYLPYAMAFGIVGKWTKAFENTAVAQPTWYVGRPGMVFNAMILNDSINSLNSAMTAAMNSAPPRQSGGSGFSGGFSGGGFGGGGGRSW